MMSNITDFIKIRKVLDDCYMVEWTFANGWKDAMRCDSEHDARVFASGLERGVGSVRHMIGGGLHFFSKIEEMESRR